VTTQRYIPEDSKLQTLLMLSVVFGTIFRCEQRYSIMKNVKSRTRGAHYLQGCRENTKQNKLHMIMKD
jgi:hypothetical protein